LQDSGCVFLVVDAAETISQALGSMFEKPVVDDAPVEAEPEIQAAGGGSCLAGLAMVDLRRDGGLQRAVRLARSGARVVICTGDAVARQATELKELAPANLVLMAHTSKHLAKTLRAVLG
jgi:hypothetical protein